jgi:polyribonucleotide nucleotidyltransferase
VITIDNIQIGKWYKGIVKLKYNYWLFVMLPWGKVEGLLHKKKIKVPEGVRWKDLYNIWDIIEVKAEKFKEIDWEKRVEWTQL